MNIGYLFSFKHSGNEITYPTCFQSSFRWVEIANNSLGFPFSYDNQYERFKTKNEWEKFEWEPVLILKIGSIIMMLYIWISVKTHQEVWEDKL